MSDCAIRVGVSHHVSSANSMLDVLSMYKHDAKLCAILRQAQPVDFSFYSCSRYFRYYDNYDNYNFYNDKRLQLQGHCHSTATTTPDCSAKALLICLKQGHFMQDSITHTDTKHTHTHTHTITHTHNHTHTHTITHNHTQSHTITHNHTHTHTHTRHG